QCRIFFFFLAPPSTAIYTLSLHDALPIFLVLVKRMNESVDRIERAAKPMFGRLDEMSREVAQTLSLVRSQLNRAERVTADVLHRSEEHTSELQSRGHLVCRLLLEKKK